MRHHYAERRSASRNISSRKCGKAPTAPSAPFWTAPCSARRSSSAASTPFISTWKKPITIARHAYGDVYKASETAVPQGAQRRDCRNRLRTAPKTRTLIHDFASGAGVVQGMHNIDRQHCELREKLLQLRAGDRSRICGSQPRTPSPRSTTTASRTSSQEIFEAEYKEKFDASAASSTSTRSSTTRSRASSARKAASSGRARITTAT